MFFPIFVSLALAIFAFISIINSTSRNSKKLPGPVGLPLIGNLHQVGAKPHLTFTKWAEKYGSIFTVKFCSQRLVIIDDPKLIKEAFAEAVFTGRPQNGIFRVASNGNHGVANSEGQTWETVRRFTIRHLRDFGFGKNYMENLILDEVAEILIWLNANTGRSISINRKFGLAVLNSLWTLTSGQRSHHDDPRLTNLIEDFMLSFNKAASYGITFSPLMCHIAPEISGWNGLLKSAENLQAYLKATVQQHEENFQDDQICDLLDNIISEIRRTGDPKSAFYNDLGCKKVEIFRLPSLADRASMPYTEAVIKETLRKSSHLPIGVFHRALEDKEFQGYMIPKGTWLVPNFYSIHHKKSVWDGGGTGSGGDCDPQHFRPERFLHASAKEGETLAEHLMPFGVGKRQCMGEHLARDTLFLFLTSIYQKFNISKEDHVELDLEPGLGFTNAPKEFKVIVKPRHL